MKRAGAACPPAPGILLDRYPARRIVLPCVTVFGLALASLALMTPSLARFYATFFVPGIVGNGTAQLAFSRAVATWFSARRGAAFAVLMTGSALGAMLWPPVVQWLTDRAGWRSAFAILGGLLLLVAWLLGVHIRERAIPAVSERARTEGSSVAPALRSRGFWIVAGVLFCGPISQTARLHTSPLCSRTAVFPPRAQRMPSQRWAAKRTCPVATRQVLRAARLCNSPRAELDGVRHCRGHRFRHHGQGLRCDGLV